MSVVLTFQQASAASRHDMVGLKLGSDRVLMYYQIAFTMAASLCMHAKMAGRYEGVHPRLFHEFIEHDALDGRPQRHRTYRRTGERPNFRNWTVGHKGNLVRMTFDDMTKTMHYSDAFRVYTVFRHHARIAKAWAGDDGKQWTTRAHLADAEQNDKFLYVA